MLLVRSYCVVCSHLIFKYTSRANVQVSIAVRESDLASCIDVMFSIPSVNHTMFFRLLNMFQDQIYILNKKQNRILK